LHRIRRLEACVVQVVTIVSANGMMRKIHTMRRAAAIPCWQ